MENEGLPAEGSREDGDPLMRAWTERDQFDPDCWFGIPDFDVKPVDVGFRGFYNPILYPGNAQLTYALRGFVRIARALVRKDGIASMRELRQTAAEVLALADNLPDEELNSEEFWLRTMSVKQRAAYSYTWCIESLERYSAFALGPLRKSLGPFLFPEGLLWQTAYSPVHPTPEEAVSNIAFFGQWITSWSYDGTQSAVPRRMQQISKNPRPRSRSQLRLMLLRAMKAHRTRNNGHPDPRSFVDAWINNDSLRVSNEAGQKFELLIEEGVEPENFEVRLVDAEGFLLEKTPYSRDTLGQLYSIAKNT
jgi:hypothetical protein